MTKFRITILSAFLIVTAAISSAAQTPAAATPAPVRVSTSEQEKRLTKRVNPKYPKDAFDAKLTGIISLETLIGTDGKVENVKLVGKGEDVLVKAAIDAVKQWVYKPYKLDGKLVEVLTIVTINFKVGDQ